MTNKDYFTTTEFRSYAGPRAGGKYSEQDIFDAQSIVIESLEQWARSSWANVTGIDADGEAADYRRVEEHLDSGTPTIFTQYAPIRRIDVFTFNGQDVDPSTYVVYNDMGMIRFADPRQVARPLTIGYRQYVIIYAYGFLADTNVVIKHSCIQATLSLLKQGITTALPQNVSQYSTEGTTFILNPFDKQVSQPWAWDTKASQIVRNYWGGRRPKRLASV